MERTEIISVTYKITKEGVEKKLRGIEPQEDLAKYFVEARAKEVSHQASNKPNLKFC